MKRLAIFLLLFPSFAFAAGLTVPQGGTGSTTLSGIIKGAGTSSVVTAVNGVDFTLITVKTCNAGDFVSAVTAAGVFTCSTPAAGTTYTGTYPIVVTGSVISTAISTSTITNLSGLVQTGTITSGTWSGSFGAVTGANLTNLTAGNVTGSHTLPDSVLSTNVPLLNAANAFTNAGSNTFVGNVGIGTTTPLAPLTVSVTNPTNHYGNGLGSVLTPASLGVTTLSTTGSGYAGQAYDTLVTPVSTMTGTVYGINNALTDPNTVTVNVPSMTGAQFLSAHLGKGIAATVQGLFNLADNFSPTTVTSLNGAVNSAQTGVAVGATTTTAIGSSNTVSNSSAYGLVTNAYATRAAILNSNANATMTNAYGVAFDSFTNSGTITNTYGMYVGSVTAGTQTNHPYSFYAADTSAYNYFGGNVGIGTSSPASSLTVNGHIGTDGGAPALTSCGTSPSVTVGSTDTAGTVTQGSISTGCTITFKTAYARAPFCVVTDQAGLVFSYVLSASAITVTNIGALSSTAMSYQCTSNDL